MIHSEGAKPPDIPQRVYDWYNAHYDNVTYRAFHDALSGSARYGDLSEAQTNDAFITEAMNLLIDASFERSGAEAQLMAQIAHLDSRLTTLARIHLMSFGDSPQEDTAQARKNARLLVESSVEKASAIHTWRARAAYGWASAAVYLVHAATAILDETNADTYPLERLDRTLMHLQNGVVEAEQNGVRFAEGFTAWIRQLVNSRR